MIKIFNANDRDFSTAGNIIIEPIKCIEYKKKSLNGWYIEVELPIKYKEYISKDKLCVVKTKSKLNPQAFRIGEDIEYSTRKIKFKADHVMFDAKDYVLLDVRPTGQNGLNALNYINERTDNVSPFSIYSNVENVNTAYFIRKNLLEAWATIEERWGGVFDADNWNISFLTSVGNDNGETIVYGRNMQGFDIYEDWSSVCTKICPVGYDGIMLEETYLESDVQYEKPYTRVVDFQTSLESEEQTQENLLAELRQNAEAYLEENKIPKVSYTVISNINEKLEIGDTIKVSHPFVEIFTEVLEYQYDLISNKVKSLTFGNYTRDVKTKFDNIKNSITQINQVLSKQEIAINTQTNLINTLNKNGYVYIDDNEILILDALPKETAKNVWRFGLGGIGFSSNGYEGPFETAITMDGQINADFITTGTLNVSRIEGLSNFISNTEKQISQIELNQGNITTRVESIETNVSNLDSKVDDEVSNLQSQIDGQIQFWNGESIPTINNYPATEWTTEEQKNNHRADIYTVIEDIDGELKQGKSYRFDKVGTSWVWVELTDNELSAVQALAQSKARVFTTTPKPPYSIGDLWIKDQELYECKVAKDSSGTYAQSDWQKATKYTDDTVANLANLTANSALDGVNNITTTQATLEGTEIKIDDGAEEPIIKLEVDGASRQDGTPTPETPIEIQSVGDDVNLFDIADKETTNFKGATINITNGVITLNGTNTSAGNYGPITSFEVSETRDYTFSMNLSDTNTGVWVLLDESDDNSTWSRKHEFNFTDKFKKAIINMSKDKYYRILLSANNGRVFNNTTIKLKLQKGTVATAYSEYGKGTVEIKQVGKNWFNKEKDFDYTNISKTEWTITQINDGLRVQSNYSTGVPYVRYVVADLTKYVGKIIRFKANFKPSENNKGRCIIGLCDYNGSNGVSRAVSDESGKEISFVFNGTEERKYLYVNLYSNGEGGTQSPTSYVDYTNVIVTIDDEDMSYVPYFKNNYVIPLSAPLRRLSNGTKDTIEEDGTHRRVGKDIVYIEGIITLSNGNIAGAFYPSKKISKGKNSLICSNAIEDKNPSLTYEEGTVYENPANVIFIGNSTDTLETIKQKYDGAELLYELAEEVIEPFDEEQEAVIDSISTMLGTQYFTCDANMRITYVRNNGLSDMYETKQSASKRSAQLQIQIDEINSKVESVEDLTVGVSGTRSVTLENCAKGSLLKLQIKGNNEVFKHLYPSDTLYPSDNLYPYGDSRIKVTNKDGEKIYELGVMDVLRANGNVYDEYILENGIAKVICKINTNGTVKTTPTEEVIGEYSIDLAEGTNTIEIVNYSATMNVLYAIKSNFTEIFATKVEVSSEISQKADEINLEVSKKVGNDEIISKINQSAEEIQINADKIDIDGKAVHFKTDISVTIGPFTNEDRSKMINYLTGKGSLSQEEIQKYDINGDGKISSADVVLVTKAITNGGYYTFSGYYEINPYSHDKSIRIYDNEQNRFETVLSLVYNYINYLYTGGVSVDGQLIVKNEYGQMFTQSMNDRFELYTDGDIRVENQITCNNLIQSSLLEKKKNFERLENGLDIVKNTDIYKYNLKSQEDIDKKHIGFVIGDKYNYSEEITSENNDGVDTYSMISVAYKAIQEQQELIEQLQNEIKQLKGENNG